MKNTEIKVKTFLLDGTECGEMTIDLYFACKAWSVTDFRKFLKTVVTPSDKATGENTPDEIADYVTETMKDWTAKIVEQVDDTDCLKAFFGGDYTEFKRYIQPKSLASDFRKFDNFLKIASPEKYEEFQSWKESQNPDKQETLSAEETTETHCRIELKNENGETVDYFSGKNKTESELLEEMRTRRGMLGENMPDYETIVYTETTTPEPETVKGESTMKENTNAVVQATEEIELTAEQLEMLDFHGLKQNAESIKFVRDMGVESECFRAVKNLKSVASNGAKIITFPRIYSMKVGNGEATEYKYFEYCVCYKKGSYYKMPESVIKSSACEIIFRVISNSGKSVTIQTFEKYNGKITENIYKNKKLNPGSHGLNMYCRDGKIYHDWNDTDGATKNVNVDCFNIKSVSRWCKDCLLYVPNCTEITAEEAEAWKQNTGTATTTPAQPKRKEAAELDFTPVFYPVSEELARQHKHMISFDEYKTGKVTAEYQEAVKEAYELARVSSDPEKSLYLADCYAKRLARWYDDYNRNGASCPSVMISGAGNFPTRKKEKQNARFDALMTQYSKIKHLLEKIRKPHGYGVEIRRDTITAEEFENILYFETVISEEENRLQLIFDGKPEEEERNILKKHGFRWSPRFKAWQRQLTENAVCAVWKVVNAFDVLEDAENSEIQAETEKIKNDIPENERTEAPEQVQEIQAVQPEESARPETIPTEADKPTETHTEPETGLTDWGDVKFEPIPGIPDPNKTGVETTGKLAEALGKLDRMRYKLDHGYISTSNSRYYAGFFAAVRAIFGEIMYNPETEKHYLQSVSETANAEENSVETVQTTETIAEPEQPETVKFEVGKIYCTISITNSDYLHAYKIISRTDKTIILENSAGERVRKRPTTTEHYKNGKKIMCETVYPDGKYSMCLVLDASEICTAGTPKQAENEHFRMAQERTRQAVKAVQQRQPITQTTTQNGTKITMTAGAAT